MSLFALPNPFLAQKLDDTVSLPPGDVPELHAPVLEKCRTVLAQCRQSGQSIGLLVVGEAGSGKSHLIAQMRRELADKPNVVLATVPLRGAFQGRLWRHLRERLVSELFRDDPGRSDRLNGLLRILRNRFPKWAVGRDASGGLLDWLLGRSQNNDSLAPLLGEFARTRELDYGLQKVLPKLASPERTSLAQAWLRGNPLDGEDLMKLGLPPVIPSEQEQEVHAREVVLSLFRLAGEATILYVCFDEVEAIQAGNHDAATLRQFATLATDLLAQSGPRVVATFIRPTLQIAVNKAVELANLQKMGQNMATLPPLAWEQVIRVTTSRLEAQPDCRQARREHAGETLWPLAPSFLQQLFEENRLRLTPRHLIHACEVEFRRLQEPGGTGPGPVPPTPDGGSGPSAEEFARMWERQRRQFVARPQAIAFDTTMAIGLPWLVALMETSLVCVQDEDPRLGDVNLLFQSSVRRRQSTGISFCNHAPRLLWHRLDRLRKQWTAAKGRTLDSLILLRAEAERTTDASQSRLKDLAQLGVRVILADRQQLAELASFQTLLTMAQEGDLLTRSGKPVETADYDIWVKDALSPAVKELLDCIFETVALRSRPARSLATYER